MSYAKFSLIMLVLLSFMIGCGDGEEGGSGKKTQFSFPEGINPDIPILLDKISEICADRWTIRFGEDNMIYLESNEKVLGVIYGFASDGQEYEHTLDASFKIVDKVTAAQVSRLFKNYDDLKKKGEAIKHERIKGSVRYEPQGPDERALVLKIREAEQRFEDFPEYKYRSVYLSQEYTMNSMDVFQPNEQNKRALQYNKDIDSLYNLFEKVEPPPDD